MKIRFYYRPGSNQTKFLKNIFSHFIIIFYFQINKKIEKKSKIREKR